MPKIGGKRGGGGLKLKSDMKVPMPKKASKAARKKV
jgi:hypothetical protein